jgi:hypothetical protein
MASWILVPCLVAMRNEFNALNPSRDRQSDGSIGDRAHADQSSDHNPDETGETPYEDPDSRNEVHAIDVDHTGPWPAHAPFGILVDEVVRRHRLGLDDRLQNVIYNGRIASRSWGWTWRDYRGSNAHKEHGHFSARYTAAQEASTRPWGLLARFGPDAQKDEMDMDKQQMQELAGMIGAAIAATPVKVGDETWKLGTAIGYVARKAYEIDATLDKTTSTPAGAAAKASGQGPTGNGDADLAVAAKPAPKPPTKATGRQ